MPEKKFLTQKFLTGIMVVQAVMLLIATLYILQLSIDKPDQYNQKETLASQKRVADEDQLLTQEKTLLTIDLNGDSYHNQNLTSQVLDKIIEDNKQTWKLYHDSQDGSFTLRYPVFLSRFQKSDSDLAPKNSLVSSYYRSANGNREYGRSFWITIQKSFQSSQNSDIYSWILATQRNILTEHPDTGVAVKTELVINKIIVGGREGYIVATKGKYPRNATVYFQTKKGIRAIGFSSFGDEKDIPDNYRVFQKVLETIVFSKY